MTSEYEVENAKQIFRDNAKKFIPDINNWNIRARADQTIEGIHDALSSKNEMMKKLVSSKRSDGLKWLAQHTQAAAAPMMFPEPAVKISESKFGFFSKVFQKPEPKPGPKPPETKIKKGF